MPTMLRAPKLRVERRAALTLTNYKYRGAQVTRLAKTFEYRDPQLSPYFVTGLKVGVFTWEWNVYVGHLSHVMTGHARSKSRALIQARELIQQMKLPLLNNAVRP